MRKEAIVAKSYQVTSCQQLLYIQVTVTVCHQLDCCHNLQEPICLHGTRTHTYIYAQHTVHTQCSNAEISFVQRATCEEWLSSIFLSLTLLTNAGDNPDLLEPGNAAPMLHCNNASTYTLYTISTINERLLAKHVTV